MKNNKKTIPNKQNTDEENKKKNQQHTTNNEQSDEIKDQRFPSRIQFLWLHFLMTICCRCFHCFQVKGEVDRISKKVTNWVVP